MKAFFDRATCTASYVVSDPATWRAAVIDTVLDYETVSGRIGTASADGMIAYVVERGLKVDWILETHVHADHLTAASYFKSKLGGAIAAGDHVTEVQRTFAALLQEGPLSRVGAGSFDKLFHDGERFWIGCLPAQVMHTPGHTPACVTYLVGDVAFVSDTLFMPDSGTARCNFPGGDAAALYRSIQRLLALAPETRVFTCHDYMPGGREPRWETTVTAQRAGNIHIHPACPKPTSSSGARTGRHVEGAHLAGRILARQPAWRRASTGGERPVRR